LVLAYKIRTPVYSYFLIATVLVLSTESCRPTRPQSVTDKTHETTTNVELPKGEVASYKVQIDVREGKCILNYDGPHKGQLETELSAPCEFSRGHTGMIEHYEYKNKGKGDGYYSVILVIGGPVDPSRSDKFMKNGCGTLTRPISLSPRGVAIGTTGGGGLVICPSTDLDEVMFGFGKKPV
jgi:hypothetical protein